MILKHTHIFSVHYYCAPRSGGHLPMCLLLNKGPKIPQFSFCPEILHSEHHLQYALFVTKWCIYDFGLSIYYN